MKNLKEYGLRIDLTKAARLLGITRETLRSYVEEGYFDWFRTKEKTGKILLLTAEVEVYAKGGLEALRAYRSSQPAEATP